MHKDVIDDYKMAVIPSDGHLELEEGEIKYFGEMNFYLLHDYAFRQFCQNYYPEILSQPGVSKNSPAELYAYYLQLDSNIVIANLTHSSTIEKHGKEAMIFMPEQISDKQKEALKSLMYEADDYNFFILYHFTLENNYPNSQNIFQTKDETPQDLLNRYFETAAQNTKK